MRKVAIIGVGMTKFGELWEKGFRELVVEAGIKALDDAGISGDKIDAGYIGTMASGRLIGQEHIGALIADYMGLNPLPITRVEGACASGSLALRQGFMAVASGMKDIVVVGGVEKMTDLGVTTVSDILGGAGDQEWELFLGATFPAIYALMARRHMHEFGTTEEMMASVAVKNHKHGAANKYAQFQKEVTMEQVLKSKMISDPLKMLDCSPISDGAAGVVLAPLDIAESYSKKPIEILASSQASDSIALHSRQTLTGLHATKVAAKKAFDFSLSRDMQELWQDKFGIPVARNDMPPFNDAYRKWGLKPFSELNTFASTLDDFIEEAKIEGALKKEYQLISG